MTPVGSSNRVTLSDPDWKVKVALMQDATNAYTASYFHVVPSFSRGVTSTVVSSPSNYHIESSDSYRGVNGWLQVNSADDVSLRELALKRLKQRLESNIGSFNVIVPAAELYEMRGLIRQLAYLSTGLVRKLIYIKKTRGLAAFKYASEAWLTYSFGIRPLLSDVSKLSEAIAAYLERSRVVVRVRGSAVKRWTTSTSWTNTGAYNSTFTGVYSAHHLLRYRYTCGVDVNLLSGNNYGVDEHFFGSGLGQNLPSVGWELLPFSWIVDYFTNVGEYFSDTFVLPPGSTKYLSLTKTYQMWGQTTGKYTATAPTIVTVSRHSPGIIKYNLIQRSKLASIPHASLRFKTADETGINAVNRLLNLSSLLFLMRKGGSI
jgi:hypothetical protein